MPPLRKLPDSCLACPLGTGPLVKGEGNPNADVMVVSACPGAKEIESGRPFAGPNGEIVRGAIQGIAGDSVWFTHLAKRAPAQGRFSPARLGACVAHFAEELRQVRPHVVVAMGAHVLSFMQHGNSRIGTMHGLLVPMKMYGATFKLLPVHDIGYVMRLGGLSSAAGHTWIDDLEEMKAVVGELN